MQLTRYDALRVLAAAALLAITGRWRAAAAAKLLKEEVAYRDRPKDGKSCSSCRQFSAVGAGKGTCAVVEGTVSASGWCMAYSPITLSQVCPIRARIAAMRSTAHSQEGVHT